MDLNKNKHRQTEVKKGQRFKSLESQLRVEAFIHQVDLIETEDAQTRNLNKSEMDSGVRNDGSGPVQSVGY